MKIIGYQRYSLYIRAVPKKGLGVFCSQDIPSNVIVEFTPVLVVPDDEINPEFRVANYTYVWDDRSVAIAWGYGNLYNHSETPNILVTRDYPNNCLVFSTLRPLSAHEELTHKYTVVWFSTHN